MSYLVWNKKQAKNRRTIHFMMVLLLVHVVSSRSVAQRVSTTQPIEINSTPKAGLLDGRCGNDEWEAATRIDLPAGAAIYLMQDEDYFYFCATGKAEDYTVLDLYVENTATGHLHKFHLSAQMGESIYAETGWEHASEKWDLKDYAGFWVPYNGLEDPENRINPLFARGTHRQMQIARRKFIGDSWNMMFGLSGIAQDGEGVELLFPEEAEPEDPSTWRKFSFTE